MALLEALPEVVENTLRELREQEQTGSSTQPALAANGDTAAVQAVVAQRPDDAVSESGTDAPSELDAEAKSGEAPGDTTPLAFATDLNAKGDFGPEWLVVDSGKVYVFGPNGGQRAHIRHAVPLARIKEAKAEMHIGNGLLEVRTDTETIPLVRFSQATVAEAHAIARHLNALAKGEEIVPEQVDTKRKTCPKCKRVLPSDTDVCPACINKRAVMLRLFRFLAPYRGMALGSVLVILASNGLELAPPYIGGRLIDLLAHPPANGQRMLFIWVGILIGLRLVGAVLQYIQRRLNAYLGARVLMDIRVALYAKFNLLSLGYYDKRSVGSVMSRITNDADNLWDFLTDGIPWLMTNVLQLVLIGIVLFRMNWQLALLLLTPGPFIFALTKWFMPRAPQMAQSVASHQ